MIQQKRLLVIDDSESNTLLIRSLFEEKGGYQVDVIRQSSKTSEYFKKHHPDLIILDLMMPHVDGFQILTMVRTDQKLKDIPIIVVSAWNDSENIQKSLELGANDYISKPINLEDLIKRVERFLT